MSTNRVEFFKIMLLGDEQTGKTQLLGRARGELFSPDYSATIGADFIQLETKEGKYFQCWEVAGQARFRPDSPPSDLYRDINVAIITFDLSKKQSFDNSAQYLKLLRDKNTKIILVGTKADLPPDQWAIREEEIRIAAKTLKASYFLTSAMTGENVNALFNEAMNLSLGKDKFNKPPIIPINQVEDKTRLSVIALIRDFLKRHWREILLGGVIVAGAIVVGITTGGIGLAILGGLVIGSVLGGGLIGVIAAAIKSRNEQRQTAKSQSTSSTYQRFKKTDLVDSTPNPSTLVKQVHSEPSLENSTEESADKTKKEDEKQDKKSNHSLGKGH